MKLLSFVVILLISFTAVAQTLKWKSQLQVNPDGNSIFPITPSNALLLKGNSIRPERNSVKISGGRIRFLPQDNMPCFIPDQTVAAIMPNVWRGSVAIPFKNLIAAIPNPSPGIKSFSFQYHQITPTITK